MAASAIPGERPLLKSEWSDQVFTWTFGPYGIADFGAANKMLALPFLQPKDIVLDSAKLLARVRTSVDAVYFCLAKAQIDSTTRVVTEPTVIWSTATPAFTGARQVSSVLNIGDTSGITALRMEDIPLVKGYGTARATSFVSGVAPGDALYSGGANYGEPYYNVIEAGTLLFASCAVSTDDTTDMSGLFITLRGRERKTY